jgi:toxin ParE1/3/4
VACSLAEQARQHIILIYRRGVATYGESQAERYADALEGAFDLLARFPHLASERAEYDPPLHLYPLDSHLILYRR